MSVHTPKPRSRIRCRGKLTSNRLLPSSGEVAFTQLIFRRPPRYLRVSTAGLHSILDAVSSESLDQMSTSTADHLAALKSALHALEPTGSIGFEGLLAVVLVEQVPLEWNRLIAGSAPLKGGGYSARSDASSLEHERHFARSNEFGGRLRSWVSSGSNGTYDVTIARLIGEQVLTDQVVSDRTLTIPTSTSPVIKVVTRRK